MKLKRFYRYILVLGTALSACSKSSTKILSETTVSFIPVKTYDTIKPLPYLPAFPGSVWKYLNDKNDTVTYFSSLYYVKDSYSISEVSSNYKSDTVLVPLYNSAPLWGSRIHVQSSDLGPNATSGTSPFIYVVSDSLTKGYRWNQYYDYNRKTFVVASIQKKDTSVTFANKIYSPTIVVYYELAASPVNIPYMRRYYTKNIGMVREELLKSSGSTIGYLQLQNYTIKR